MGLKLDIGLKTYFSRNFSLSPRNFLGQQKKPRKNNCGTWKSFEKPEQLLRFGDLVEEPERTALGKRRHDHLRKQAGANVMIF
jgi:hypothetical protein